MKSDFSTSELMLKHLGGETTAEEAQQLSQLLLHDAEARHDWLNLVLEAIAITESAVVAEPMGIETVQPKLRQRVTKVQIFLVAAVLFLSLFSTVLWFHQKDPGILRVERVEGNVRWIGRSGAMQEIEQVGTHLPGGLVEALDDASMITVAFHDGTEVSLTGESQATFSITHRKQIHLRAGNLSAQVVKQKLDSPLTLITPTAQMEVLGTELSVDALQTQTLLRVHEGKVRIKRLADGNSQMVSGQQIIAVNSDTTHPMEVYSSTEVTPEWQLDLHDISQQNWKGTFMAASENLPARLQAEPHVVENRKSGPQLLHRIAWRMDRGNAPRVQAQSEMTLRLHGRLKEPARLICMLTATDEKGRFMNNFFQDRIVYPDAHGFWEWHIPLSWFQPQTKRFHQTIDKLLLKQCLVYTRNNRAQLELHSADLRLTDNSL